MSKEVTDFIKRYAGDVMSAVKGTGVFPSLTMAQMIIESSGKDSSGVFHIGEGLAARKANNFFGVKADHSWKGKAIQLSTPRDGKPVSLFRVYNSAHDSISDHTRFLLANSRYKASGVFNARTPQEQAQALQRAGYSESPTYGQTLIGLIHAYQLEDLDKPPSPGFKPFYLLAAVAIIAASVYCFRGEIAAHLFNHSQTLIQT